MTLYAADCERQGLYDTPQSLENRPGLDELRYRVGTFTSFRNTMVRRITRIEIEVDGQRIPAPLRTWSARDSDDYGIALIELWAYVADILTFYQERIVNEAFIRTANLRESLMQLASLLQYTPSPGVAAAVYLTFMAKGDYPALLLEGFKVQHIPIGDEKPQKFEISNDLLIQTAWNQLTPLPDVLEPITFHRNDTFTHLAGTRLRIAPGDWVLIVGRERTDEPVGTVDTSERFEIRRIVNVEPIPADNETRIDFDEPLGSPFSVVEPTADVFVFRGKGALFGHNAADWRAIPLDMRKNFMELTGTTDTATDTEAQNQVDWPNQEANDARRIDLDRKYERILPDSWVVLMTASAREVYQVVQVQTEARTDYLRTGQVTRLILDSAENFSQFGLSTSADTFDKIRRTTVLFNSEFLPVAHRVVPVPIESSFIEVVEDVSTLETGHQIMVYGPTEPDGEWQGEVVTVRRIEGGGHTIRLDGSLQHSYRRDETQIFANVVAATHGETVADEVLGNGDPGIPFQTFALKQAPLTYVAQAGAPGGVASTLTLRVNGIRWDEVPTFYDRRGNEAIYTIDIADDGVATIRLGDGTTGALPSTGRNNVFATYRKGLGRIGNQPAETIKTPLARPKGLKSVINPLPSSGGTDPETADQIRTNAPNTVLTFGRIVSLRDFENAARDFVGVSKARAFIEWDEEWQSVKLVVAGEDGKEIVNPQYQTLVDDLNSRRDPNRKLTVVNYDPVDLQLWLIVYPDPAYLEDIVQANVAATIERHFMFDELELGQSIALSEIYYVIHEAEGVIGAEVTHFRAVMGPNELEQVVFIANDQLARLDMTDEDTFTITMEASS